FEPEDFVGRPLDVLGDPVAVDGAEHQGAQNQHVKSALQEGRAVVVTVFGHESRQTTMTKVGRLLFQNGWRAALLSYAPGRSTLGPYGFRPPARPASRCLRHSVRRARGVRPGAAAGR